MGNAAEIAIIGAGPAGAHLAARLASAGLDVALFDPKGAWEKPCGGGLTARALREFSFLLEGAGSRMVERVTISSASGLTVSVRLEDPLAIYSRRALNGLLLDRAICAGARFIQAKASRLEKRGGLWEIVTSSRERWSARFLVGADGAASFCRRRLVAPFPKRDLSIAFGYNLDIDSLPQRARRADEIVIRFLKGLSGYIWAFPRVGVVNFGIICKLGEISSEMLRSMLESFISEYCSGQLPALRRMNFFGAKVPTLAATTWAAHRASGPGWALIGDAAGFADPITGEGIYYALKSADLLADALLAGAETYESLWRAAFGRELEHASSRTHQFYHGRFAGLLVTDAMVLLARLHRGVRQVLAATLAGQQSYLRLRRDLAKRALMVF
jgi:flavin-dependent dehydrogenase